MRETTAAQQVSRAPEGQRRICRVAHGTGTDLHVHKGRHHAASTLYRPQSRHLHLQHSSYRHYISACARRLLPNRSRLALDHKSKSKEWLDARKPLILSDEEFERLGGEERGYERVRRPMPDPADFTPGFDLHTEEHRAWLLAEGTI